MNAKNLSPLALALALALACTAAVAQHSNRGWYVGASVGSSKAKFDTDFPAVPGATSMTQTKDEQGTPFKLYLGYQPNRHFALEGGWTRLGSFDATQNVNAPFSGSTRADVKVGGFHLDALGIIPAGNLAAFFKAGVMHTKTRTNFSATGAAPAPAEEQVDQEVNWKFGVGMSYAFSPGWAARLEFEQVSKVGTEKTGEMNIRMWSVGLSERF
jgi:OmpA-OmpF porin, OOP family